MSEIVNFKAFCLERYKFKHNLNGKDVIHLFLKYGVLEYISSFYDVLHTFGDQYIIEDIDRFIEVRQDA